MSGPSSAGDLPNVLQPAEEGPDPGPTIIEMPGLLDWLIQEEERIAAAALPLDMQGDEESGYGGMRNSGFADQSNRIIFTRKVYSIFAMQLIVAMGFIGFFFIPSVALFCQENPALDWAAKGFSIIMMRTLACVPSIKRKSPRNLVLLALLTMCEGWLIGGVISSTYEVTEVLIAVGMTAGVVFALALFAMQTKIEVTAWRGALLCALMVFILAVFIAAFFPQARTTRLVFAVVGEILFSIYIVQDTQMMMDGNHKYTFDPEEYVFAALILSLDIIQETRAI